jgi:hypothetical protein
MITEVVDALAVPAGLVVSTLASWALALAAGYLRERTHNELLARVVGGAGRLAGTIHDTLACMPVSGRQDGQAVKQAMIVSAVRMLKGRMPDTIDRLGVSDEVLGSMIGGELGKMTALTLPSSVPMIAAEVNKPR